jgi:chaperonin GroEL (HSP60 family)
MLDFGSDSTAFGLIRLLLQNGAVGETGVVDLLTSKESAIRLATEAAITVLRISQIIMAKQAGIKVPDNRAGGTMGAMDQDED